MNLTSVGIDSWAAILISILSFGVAIWSVKVARAANRVARFNSLTALRGHYQEQIEHNQKLAKLLGEGTEGHQLCLKHNSDLDNKLRKIGVAIGKCHKELVDKS
jgi:ABC-type Fe3+-citrate transport system substrate-binding protein